MKTKSVMFSLLGTAVLAAAFPAQAVDLNLTAGGTGTINGAIFQTSDNQSTGTGVIQSFVRVQDNGIADGYNTSARPVFYDENTSPTFTRDLQLAFVPIVNIGGVNYREFLLDINQQNSSPLLSLDKIQIYVSATGNQSGAIGTFGTKVYDLDTGTDSTILLNYSLNNGSGSGDMFAYIPNAVFAGANYVTLYSMFGARGGAYAENDGFEEWAVRSVQTLPVPEPGTYALMLAGLGVVGFMARRRRQA